MKHDPKELKAQVRALVRAELRHIPAQDRHWMSLCACSLLKQQEAWLNARSILFYAPIADELDVSLLWTDAESEHKIIALPQFNDEQGHYIVRQLPSASGPFLTGRFGIREPSADSPVLALNQLDLALVPGVAFDLSGRRLGRGSGYYDRLLANVSGIKCGVAFDQQITAEIPAEFHDVRLDCILTPSRWLSFGQGADVK